VKSGLIIVVIVFILSGVTVGYIYWHSQLPMLERRVSNEKVISPPSLVPQLAASTPEMRQVLDVPKVVPQLPVLDYSDNHVFNSLAVLIDDQSLMSLFFSERIIHNIVATIDNLTNTHAPRSVMPVKPVSGMFYATIKDDKLIISSENAVRYAPYVRIAEAAEPKKLVDLYLGLYPLFQEAYEKLGYPKKYFNDRLIEVIDDLLAAPDIKDPVKLEQPNTIYQFADSNLEACHIGQRILMRMGNKNETYLKSWLSKIKQELMLHMHQKKLDSVG